MKPRKPNPAAVRIPPCRQVFPLFASLPALFTAGCGAGLAGRDGVPPDQHAYYRDAQVCHRETTIKPRVRANIGQGVSYREFDTGTDPAAYLACMERHGWQQDAGTDPLLKALEVCREQARRPASATARNHRTRPAAYPDRAVFEECLRRRGLDGEVILGPLEPEARRRKESRSP